MSSKISDGEVVRSGHGHQAGGRNESPVGFDARAPALRSLEVPQKEAV